MKDLKKKQKRGRKIMGCTLIDSLSEKVTCEQRLKA